MGRRHVVHLGPRVLFPIIVTWEALGIMPKTGRKCGRRVGKNHLQVTPRSCQISIISNHLGAAQPRDCSFLSHYQTCGSGLPRSRYHHVDASLCYSVIRRREEPVATYAY
jgi:hypothetical protein